MHGARFNGAEFNGAKLLLLLLLHRKTHDDDGTPLATS